MCGGAMGHRKKRSERGSRRAEELLQAAAEAFHGAPNRAVKRRIRQRLHKKLGTMLNREQFEKAMDRFWTLEEEHEVIEEVMEAPVHGTCDFKDVSRFETGSTSTRDEESQGGPPSSDLGPASTWERALSEKVELPVVRTFIQFDTCPREHLRRSKSVPR
mmetsp:Transcript_33026/g.77060  ORF Transcript_33026/g.77060 Transcript_33026/m.77060 type:complete len:160 (+) Transcript_33026:100-579(+)